MSPIAVAFAVPWIDTAVATCTAAAGMEQRPHERLKKQSHHGAIGSTRTAHQGNQDDGNILPGLDDDTCRRLERSY